MGSGLAARAENESRAKRVAEEDMAELEKEKMMIELELEEISSKHKSQLRNLEMQLTASRDTESDLRHEYDMVTKDKEELETRCGDLEDELMKVMKRKTKRKPVMLRLKLEK